MQNPKVSVIIPVYNGSKTLKECLASVLNQTYNNYEVIVVDNNSTDNTKKIIKEFQEKADKIKYVFEAKIGRGAARNAGIKLAEGKIIAMTDSDCIVPQNWLETLIKPILCDGENAVMGSEKEIISNFWTKNIQKVRHTAYNKCANGKYINFIDTKNFAIKSEIVKNLMFDQNLKACEDIDFYLRTRKHFKIVFLESLKVLHYDENVFGKIIKKNLEKGFWTAKIYKKYSRDKKLIKKPMFESLSLTSFINFVPWLAVQFIKKPFLEAFFTLVSETSWRLGALSSYFTK